MDQNLVRTDLLPASVPSGLLVGLALAGVAAWVLAHYVARSRLARFAAPYRALAVMPFAVAASWLVLQAAGRFLYLGTTWSLFFSAVVAAVAFEGVAALYRHEKTRAPRRAGRWIVALRLAALGVVFFALMQPVLVGERKRTVRSRVVVLVDDSASMHFVDRLWTDAERIDVACALGVADAPDNPFRDIAEKAETYADAFELVRQMASAGGEELPGGETAGEAAKTFAALAEAIERDLPRLAASREELRGELDRLRTHLRAALAPACARLDDAVRAGDAPAAAAAAKAACEALAEARPALASAAQLAPLAWFDGLDENARAAVTAATDAQRAEIVRQLLARGGEESLLRRLARRYDLDVFRFGHEARRDESYLDGEARADGADAVASYVVAGADDAAEGGAAAGARLDTRTALFRSTTDITRALETVMREIPTEELSSVVVFTDGRHNGDAGVESVARRLGSLGVDVSTVVVGGTQPPFDLAIASARAPESVFLGDKVRFAVEVAATRAKGRQAVVRLMKGEDTLDTRTLDIDSDDWHREVRFAHDPEEKGVYRYHVEVKLVSGELFAENNEWDLDVAVSDERTNVFLVDNRPRWEFRYLRNLFYGRDKSVHLQDYLLTPDRISAARGGEPEALPAASADRPFGESESGDFPQGLEEWRKFDVIIVGDLSDAQLPEEAVRNIRYCVEERGALLVVIAGPESMPYKVADETFRSLLPVEYAPDGAEHRAPPEEDFTFSLTAAGRGHPVMSQSSSAAENEDIWADLPYFHWRVPVDGVKPGAEVLAYAKSAADAEAGAAALAQSVAASVENDPEEALRRLEEMRGEQARHALVVARAQGRGKVVMINTDRMWQLRYRVGDTRHHRFWGQVLRWGAGEKLRVGNAFVRLGTDQLRYGVDEPVAVYARLLDTGYNGIAGLRPRVVLTDRAGNGVRAAWLEPRPDSNGFYEGSLAGLDEPGTYALRLECDEAQGRLGADFPAQVETRFVVVTAKQPAEAVDVTASRAAPERMAKATRGRVMTPSEWIARGDDFGDGNKTSRDRTEYPLWSMPPLFLLLILLLTAEWIIRKRVNLA